MKRSSWIQTGLLVAAAVALVALVVARARGSGAWPTDSNNVGPYTTSPVLVAAVQAAQAEGRDPYAHHTGIQPPARLPTTTDKIISRMINSVEYSMRSLELIDWLCRSIAAQMFSIGYSCTGIRDINYGYIASRVPGIQYIARGELQKHMRALVTEACKTARTGTQLVQAIRQYGDSAMTLLIDMPGYAILSSQDLPPVFDLPKLL